MTFTRRRILIGVSVLALAAIGTYLAVRYRREQAKPVSIEAIQTHDLAAIVSASGKIQPKRSVNISADTMGRITELAVDEGQRVAAGQFLMQIDPRNLQTAVQRNEAGLAAAQAQLEQLRASAATARQTLELAQANARRQRELWDQQLTTREALERAETERKVRESELRDREATLVTQERRIEQERAALAGTRYDLSKVRIESPINGIVTRRNIEEGETVVVGTMNNPGTVLLTIADMSVIEAELEVDETDIPSVQFGQTATVTIDALPDLEFTGQVTEIGNSPIQQTGQPTTTTAQATNFKVVVTLSEAIPDVRPGFTCTADITTATRAKVIGVPIQALVVREVTYAPGGAIVRARHDGTAGAPRTGDGEAAGYTRKEEEGVFLLRDGIATFTPVRTGIAGERYFEVLSGLEPGDRVITGPFSSVRELRDGDRVREEEEEGGSPTSDRSSGGARVRVG